MTIEYADGEKLGNLITQDALTQACQESGDVSIVIGFSPTPEQAESALEQHLSDGGGRVVLVDPVTPSRGARRGRRGARR